MYGDIFVLAQYPDLYAPAGHKNAKEYNSVQRAHQNTLENILFVMLPMLLNGLTRPVITTTLHTRTHVYIYIHATDLTVCSLLLLLCNKNATKKKVGEDNHIVVV